MKPTGLFYALLALALVAGSFNMPALAQDAQSDVWGYLENVEDRPMMQYTPSGYAYPGYAQPYVPYPAQAMVPAEKPPEKKPWYKRLLPGKKSFSQPINLMPKLPKEAGRETPVLKDPMIRLAKGLMFNGRSVPPGIYLLSLKDSANGDNATLSIVRRQEALLTLPAFKETSSTPPPPEQSQVALPSPPDEKAIRASRYYDVPLEEKKQEPLASAHVELAQDGRTMILVYQVESQRYTSVPVPVGATWQD